MANIIMNFKKLPSSFGIFWKAQQVLEKNFPSFFNFCLKERNIFIFI